MWNINLQKTNEQIVYIKSSGRYFGFLKFSLLITKSSFPVHVIICYALNDDDDDDNDVSDGGDNDNDDGDNNDNNGNQLMK